MPGEFAQSSFGMFENENPICMMVAPTRVLDATARNTLTWNQARLTSHADVHATIKGLVRHPSSRTRAHRGVDLLADKLPANRSCEEASIAEGLCLPGSASEGGGGEECEVSADAANSAKRSIVAHMNAVTSDYATECSVLDVSSFEMDSKCFWQAATPTVHLEVRLRSQRTASGTASAVFFARVQQNRNVGTSRVLHLIRQTRYSDGPSAAITYTGHNYIRP